MDKHEIFNYLKSSLSIETRGNTITLFLESPEGERYVVCQDEIIKSPIVPLNSKTFSNIIYRDEIN